MLIEDHIQTARDFLYAGNREFVERLLSLEKVNGLGS